MSNELKPTDDVIDAEFEVAGKMSGGQSLIVAEVNAIRSMAVAKPRDEMAIADKVKATLKKLPGMAVKMRYCKPVGWKTFAKCACGKEYEAGGWQIMWNDRQKAKACPKCNQKQIEAFRYEQQYARGLSVKAAEYLATEIMYCRTDVGVEKIDNDTYKVWAKFFDVQSGRYNSREAIVSRLKKKWGGGIEREDDERFFGMTIPAAQSKILREMVNRAVPFVIRHVLEETVDEVCAIVLSESDVAAILAGYKRFQLTANDLEAILGVKQEHWTQEERHQCRDMFESLKNKEVTRDELLAAITAAADGTQQTTNTTTATPATGGTVTAADLENAGKAKTPATDAKPAAGAGTQTSGLFKGEGAGDGKATKGSTK
jgi:hypothetical protein